MTEEERRQIEEKVAQARERIAEAAAAAGRRPEDITLVAATKMNDADRVRAAIAAGVDVCGENRVQELLEKYEQHAYDGCPLHFIGTLQTNKVKYIAGWVDMVQSLDRDSLAQELSRRAQEHNRVLPVLVQVNIAREPQKGGVDEEDLESFLRRCAPLPGSQVRGLMAIMPLVSDPEALRPYFRRMRGWFDRLRDEGIDNTSMDVLSMGMSGDCIVAAQEGATMVRLGRALFGARPQKN